MNRNIYVTRVWTQLHLIFLTYLQLRVFINLNV